MFPQRFSFEIFFLLKFLIYKAFQIPYFWKKNKKFKKRNHKDFWILQQKKSFSHFIKISQNDFQKMSFLKTPSFLRNNKIQMTFSFAKKVWKSKKMSFNFFIRRQRMGISPFLFQKEKFSHKKQLFFLNKCINFYEKTFFYYEKHKIFQFCFKRFFLNNLIFQTQTLASLTKVFQKSKDFSSVLKNQTIQYFDFFFPNNRTSESFYFQTKTFVQQFQTKIQILSFLPICCFHHFSLSFLHKKIKKDKQNQNKIFLPIIPYVLCYFCSIQKSKKFEQTLFFYSNKLSSFQSKNFLGFHITKSFDLFQKYLMNRIFFKNSILKKSIFRKSEPIKLFSFNRKSKVFFFNNIFIKNMKLRKFVKIFLQMKHSIFSMEFLNSDLFFYFFHSFKIYFPEKKSSKVQIQFRTKFENKLNFRFHLFSKKYHEAQENKKYDRRLFLNIYFKLLNHKEVEKKELVVFDNIFFLVFFSSKFLRYYEMEINPISEKYLKFFQIIPVLEFSKFNSFQKIFGKWTNFKIFCIFKNFLLISLKYSKTRLFVFKYFQSNNLFEKKTFKNHLNFQFQVFYLIRTSFFFFESKNILFFHKNLSIMKKISLFFLNKFHKTFMIERTRKMRFQYRKKIGQMKHSLFSTFKTPIFKINYEEFCLWVYSFHSKKRTFFNFFSFILKNSIFQKAKIFLIFLSNNYRGNDFLNFFKLLKNQNYFHFLASSIYLSPIPLYFQTLRKTFVHSFKYSSIDFIQKFNRGIIANWCYFYLIDSYFQIFSYCDYLFIKLFWKYARKTHPNKSKKWIQKKYFFQSIFSSFYFLYNRKHKNFFHFSRIIHRSNS